MQDPVVIVSYARTPIGAFKGCFASLSAVELGAAAIKGALNKLLVKIECEEALMGCVLSAGVGQSPARQAAIRAGLSDSICSTTINKVCGSGMRSVMLAADALMLRHCDTAVAGGMESMTNAPYLLQKARAGYGLGHDKIIDHMMRDGLEDAYLPNGVSMGMLAEETAEAYGFGRTEQDEFALRSVKRAQKANTDGVFAKEIIGVEIRSKKDTIVVDRDEAIMSLNPDKIPTLRPCFKENGTITAASSSSISDGGAAMILMKESKAVSLGLRPIAKICGYASFSHAPRMFTTAPIGAINKLLNKLNWSKEKVDLYEINEAFAVVAMAVVRDLSLSMDNVNIHGGACALGHPLGTSGARILISLLNALQLHSLSKGIAALCVGGGEAVAIGVEMC
ncbi:MAG: acetyl-CoA C-acyltransferase [Holosporales bacterium]|nr:acetyl-CoA C-acyltransferase [Holosporales bacterium]